MVLCGCVVMIRALIYQGKIYQRAQAGLHDLFLQSRISPGNGERGVADRPHVKDLFFDKKRDLIVP